ncbi:hypothetical protein [Gloeothece citriformis]|nr:hypothetical protein [Gloeothece citriformis]
MAKTVKREEKLLSYLLCSYLVCGDDGRSVAEPGPIAIVPYMRSLLPTCG